MQDMQLWQALLLGALQGVAELFPISSLAQTILIPDLLGWAFDKSEFLSFVVALHLATAVALVAFFWKDWIKVIRGFFNSVTHAQLDYDKESKFAWLLIVGTVFVGAAGLAGEKSLRNLFEKPEFAWIVACILVVNGFVMIFGDFIKLKLMQRKMEEAQHAPDLAMHAALVGHPLSLKSAGTGYSAGRHAKEAEDLTFTQGALVGAAQTFALLPGISRSGVTIVAGLFAGLSYEEASRFTFMLATPVIGLAALLKIPSLFKPEAHGILMLAIYGSIVAFIAAYLSVKFLMSYFHSKKLTPFGIFCIVFGLAAALYLKQHPPKNVTQEVPVDSSSQIITQNPPAGG